GSMTASVLAERPRELKTIVTTHRFSEPNLATREPVQWAAVPLQPSPDRRGTPGSDNVAIDVVNLAGYVRAEFLTVVGQFDLLHDTLRPRPDASVEEEGFRQGPQGTTRHTPPCA